MGQIHIIFVDENCPLIASYGMVWVLRNVMPRTLSGPEGSSNKWKFPCAADKPSLALYGAIKGQFHRRKDVPSLISS